MGLVLDNIKYKNLLNNVSCRFPRRRITGIYGDNSKYLLDIINGDINDFDGTIMIERTEINNDFYRENSSAIALIDSKPYFFSNNVDDEFKFNLSYRNFMCDDIEKKERETLDLVGLSQNILKRNINTLSTSEKYLLAIAINLIFEPDVIIFKDIFIGLDHNNRKKIKMLINNLKEDQRIIIVTSRSTNILYDITDEVILFDNNTIYKSGASDKLFVSSDLTREGIVPMPSLTKVSYLAKTDKKINLSYHRDVRDIIKDIYKHV